MSVQNLTEEVKKRSAWRAASRNLAHNSHTELPKRPAKPHFSTDPQSLGL
jgi:hypothetical protein